MQPPPIEPEEPDVPEPTDDELEAVREDEELRLVRDPEVPDEVKEEILEEAERRREEALEAARGDESD